MSTWTFLVHLCHYYPMRAPHLDERISVFRRCPITAVAGKYNVTFFHGGFATIIFRT